MSSNEELEQIIKLQQINLPWAISSEEKEKEGFVTVHHDFNILKRMNDVCPHIIAKDKDKVVAYALCMHPQFEKEIDVLKPMFREINTIKNNVLKGEYIVMGQICVARPYRRQGLFRKLYETMQSQLSSKFQIIITEVDSKNVRSLEAHYTIGFELLYSYQSDGHDWQLIGLKTKNT